MKVQELVRYGFPQSLLERWESKQGPELFPLQVRAVRESGLLSGKSLVVSSPAGTGKTFIGEMAAVRQAAQGRKSVYLVPLKALAREKYREFQKRYSQYGIRVVLSTRDHRDMDNQVLKGEFDLAILVYEKMLRLLCKAPRLAEDIRTVVVDETQMIGDPDRGPGLELLISFLRSRGVQTQIICLSAVFPNSSDLADWIDGDLISWRDRQCELRVGVFYDGVFRYRLSSGYEYGEETFPIKESPAEEEVLALMVRILAEREELCLLFVRSRKSSRQIARMLAKKLELPGEFRNTIRDLPETRSRNLLEECLPKGVGFHNSDLTPKEREKVEEAFRELRLPVLVATGTLAMGLNLPAVNVFVDPEKWVFDPRWELSWKEAITRAEFLNMGGRAGRLEARAPVSRAILVADTEFTRDALWERYIETDCEPVGSVLLNDNPTGIILSSMALCDKAVGESGIEVIRKSFFAAQGCLAEDETNMTESCMEELRSTGMIDARNFSMTPFGKGAAETGVHPKTAVAIREFLVRESLHVGGTEPKDWAFVRFVKMALLTPDGMTLLFPMDRIEWDPLEELEARFRLDEEFLSDDCSQVTPSRMRKVNRYRMARTILILADWRAGQPTREMESRHGIYVGSLMAAANHASWVFSSASRLAEAVLAPPDKDIWMKWTREIAAECEKGLPSSTRELWKYMKKGLTREDVLTLSAGNARDPGNIDEETWTLVRNRLSPPGAKVVEKLRITQTEKHSPPASGFQLVLDSGHPLQVQVSGRKTRLREKEYRLLEVLAENPGKCVSYDEIYDHLWGNDTVVEPGQMNHHKAKLVKKLGGLCGLEVPIETIPKHGYRLAVPKESVTVIK